MYLDINLCLVVKIWVFSWLIFDNLDIEVDFSKGNWGVFDLFIDIVFYLFVMEENESCFF